MAVSHPAKKAPPVSVHSEFVKALDIIDQTQLTLFVDATPPDKSQQLALYEARMQELEVESGEPLEEKRVAVMRSIISETISHYNDKYANYIPPEPLKKYASRRAGNVDGIGLKFRAVPGDYPLAIGPLLGGPMEGTDIKPGDCMLRIDDTELHGLTSAQIEPLLKGPSGSSVTLWTSRDGEERSIETQRAAVKLHYEDGELLRGDIGYILISRFGSDTHHQVKKRVAELLLRGAKRFIVDVRGNPGGSTLAARAIVSIFCSQEVVYLEKFKNGASRKLLRRGECMTDLPLAVLINEDSMSCSEILAGAVQSYERGIVVGSTSYGKGLIQKVFTLQAPLGGAIRTTIAEFARPDGRSIHAVGVEPDRAVKTRSDFMFKRTGSLNVSSETKAFQRTLLEQAVRKQYPKLADGLIAANDAQLEAAIEALNERVASCGSAP